MVAEKLFHSDQFGAVRPFPRRYSQIPEGPRGWKTVGFLDLKASGPSQAHPILRFRSHSDMELVEPSVPVMGSLVKGTLTSSCSHTSPSRCVASRPKLQEDEAHSLPPGQHLRLSLSQDKQNARRCQESGVW